MSIGMSTITLLCSLWSDGAEMQANLMEDFNKLFRLQSDIPSHRLWIEHLLNTDFLANQTGQLICTSRLLHYKTKGLGSLIHSHIDYMTLGYVGSNDFRIR